MSETRPAGYRWSRSNTETAVDSAHPYVEISDTMGGFGCREIGTVIGGRYRVRLTMSALVQECGRWK
ncbi:MAG: hypothetical protein PHE53_07385 [Thermoguttaceae bacterium]|nr:hypothetical protein [Thermoguttaceae bacterium]